MKGGTDGNEQLTALTGAVLILRRDSRLMLTWGGVLVLMVVFGSSNRLATAYGLAVTGTLLLTTTIPVGVMYLAAVLALGTPPDVEDIEHMCALLTSCDRLPFPPQMIPSNVAACVNAMTQELASPNAVKFSLTIRECGLRANSCSELRSCSLRGAKMKTCRVRGFSRSKNCEPRPMIPALPALASSIMTVRVNCQYTSSCA